MKRGRIQEIYVKPSDTFPGCWLFGWRENFHGVHISHLGWMTWYLSRRLLSSIRSIRVWSLVYLIRSLFRFLSRMAFELPIDTSQFESDSKSLSYQRKKPFTTTSAMTSLVHHPRLRGQDQPSGIEIASHLYIRMLKKQLIFQPRHTVRDRWIYLIESILISRNTKSGAGKPPFFGLLRQIGIDFFQCVIGCQNQSQRFCWRLWGKLI